MIIDWEGKISNGLYTYEYTQMLLMYQFRLLISLEMQSRAYCACFKFRLPFSFDQLMQSKLATWSEALSSG